MTTKLECPVECCGCGAIYDGAEWNDCPRCEMRVLKERGDAFACVIETAIGFLDDGAPLHARDALRESLSNTNTKETC